MSMTPGYGARSSVKCGPTVTAIHAGSGRNHAKQIVLVRECRENVYYKDEDDKYLSALASVRVA